MKSHYITALGGLLLALGGSAQAEDIEGMNGVLNISGSMHKTPCSLEMTSLHQTIELGDQTIGQGAYRVTSTFTLDYP